MTTLLNRIDNLVSVIDEREERERRYQELKGLVRKFAILNNELTDVAWSSRFAIEISEDQGLQRAYERLKKMYCDLEKQLIKLWGRDGERIDVLKPGEFYEPLDDLTKAYQEVERKTEDVIRAKRKDAETAYTLAQSFSMIPDIELDLQVFGQARNFISNAIYSSLPAFVGKSEDEYKKRIKTWESLSRKLVDERKKMDFSSIRGKKLSARTLDLIRKFVANEGHLDFESLDGETVEELKAKFPELSKKLRVSLS